MQKISGSKKSMLGAELVSGGIITPEQLKVALDEQRKLKGDHRERLGEILLRSGAVDESTLTVFLEKHLNIPYIKLRSGGNVDPAAYLRYLAAPIPG